MTKSIEDYKYACEKDDLKLLQFLILRNEDFKNLKDENGRNLLIISVFNHSYKIVEFLLNLGFDINSTNDKGTTVFMFAKTKVLENDNYNFLTMLINRGADLHKKDMFSKDVFDYVEIKRNQKMIDYLKKYR